jgi:hypothetical protein
MHKPRPLRVMRLMIVSRLDRIRPSYHLGADKHQDGLSHVFGRGQTRSCSFPALAALAWPRPAETEHASATQFKFIFTLRRLPSYRGPMSEDPLSGKAGMFKSFEISSSARTGSYLLSVSAEPCRTRAQSVYILCRKVTTSPPLALRHHTKD